MHDFVVVWSERALLLRGLGNTILLSLTATVAAFTLGTLVALVLMSSKSAYRRPVTGFVDAMRCVPFLLFAYIVYYGLPSLGLNLDNWSAGLAQPVDPIDAGYAFGFSGLGHFRRIVLPPLLLSAAPVVGNQIIQIVKDSAFLTVIALPELTHAASSIQSRHYIPFAAFITAVLLYWTLCLVIEACVASIGRRAEARR
jgi:polar amino acid transport system permease protein